MLHVERSFFMLLKLGHFGKQIRCVWKVLKRSEGEERRKLAGPIV